MDKYKQYGGIINNKYIKGQTQWRELHWSERFYQEYHYYAIEMLFVAAVLNE